MQSEKIVYFQIGNNVINFLSERDFENTSDFSKEKPLVRFQKMFNGYSGKCFHIECIFSDNLESVQLNMLNETDNQLILENRIISVRSLIDAIKDITMLFEMEKRYTY